jgi:gliding motility-associated-like protein
MGVTASLCGANGASFDSYIYLLDGSCTTIASDDDGCGSQSTVSYSLCNPGTYYIVVDAVTALEMGTFTLNVFEDPNFTFSATTTPSDVSCNGFSDGSITLAVTGGAPPYTFLWGGGQTTQDISGIPIGNYTVTVTDSDGCSTTASATLNQPPPLTASATSTDVTCGGATDGTATAVGAGGSPPYSYQWNSIPPQANPTAILLGAGTYTATVIDDHGCLATASTTVGTSTTMLVTLNNLADVSCFGANDGSIDISVAGGDPPYIYVWSDGQTTEDATGLPPGAYDVTISDVFNCTVNEVYFINEPTLLTSNINMVIDADCNGSDDGSIDLSTAGGTPPYSYLWSNANTTEDLLDVIAGNYSVTITDDNGCTTTNSAVIDEPLALSASILGTDVLCWSENTGSADLTISGGTVPYAFFWTNFAVTEDVNGLSAGSYAVMVMDDNNCILIDSVEIFEPTELTTQIAFNEPLCNAGSDGNIDLIVSGGTLAYGFSWSNSATTEDLAGIGAANYIVTVTDGNGCIEMDSANLSEPAAISTSIVSIDNSCEGDSTGSLDLTVLGATPPYTFLWSDGSLTEDLINVEAGSYSVTITDANGCTGTENGNISEPTAVTGSIIGSDVLCFGDNNGSADLSVLGGTPPYTFLWSNAETTEDINSLGGGTYQVVVTDANGCVFVETTDIVEPAEIALDFSTTEPLCNGDATGSVDMTVIGGNLPLTFNWSNSALTEDLTNVSAATYDVTVTDANLCTATGSIDLTEPLAMTLETIGIDINCIGDADGIAIVNSEGGINPYSYLWDDPPATTESVAQSLMPGTYTVFVTDINGCVSSTSILISEPLQNPEECFSGFADIVVPTAFTPNADGKNDVFSIHDFNGVEPIQWMVFNRWGEKVFASVSFNDGWDGFYKSKPALIGTYVYFIEALSLDGEPIMKKGTVTLVR